MVLRYDSPGNYLAPKPDITSRPACVDCGRPTHADSNFKKCLFCYWFIQNDEIENWINKKGRFENERKNQQN